MKIDRKAAFAFSLGMCLVGFGMLAGVAIERMRFDHKRAGILARYDEAVPEWRAFRTELERIAVPHPQH